MEPGKVSKFSWDLACQTIGTQLQVSQCPEGAELGRQRPRQAVGYQREAVDSSINTGYSMPTAQAAVLPPPGIVDPVLPICLGVQRHQRNAFGLRYFRAVIHTRATLNSVNIDRATTPISRVPPPRSTIPSTTPPQAHIKSAMADRPFRRTKKSCVIGRSSRASKVTTRFLRK